MRRPAPTAERTVTRGEAKVPEQFALDWKPAIRERPPPRKKILAWFDRIACGHMSGLLGLCCTDRLVNDWSPPHGFGSGNADGLRASKLKHAVQGMNCDGDFGGATSDRSASASAFPITRLSRLIAGPPPGPDACTWTAFCQPMRPCSLTLWRCRSRWVGAISAVSLSTAVDRGGTITSASGWCLPMVP